MYTTTRVARLCIQRAGRGPFLSNTWMTPALIRQPRVNVLHTRSYATVSFKHPPNITSLMSASCIIRSLNKWKCKQRHHQLTPPEPPMRDPRFMMALHRSHFLPVYITPLTSFLSQLSLCLPPLTAVLY